ncbi:MAG: glycoside hydrolase family 3 C-terminal domain-containing protein, partial [Muriicola sp.]|nr:glycoside hydrolase family 3 C-terminal domain-containing protein [Muriicola sp.]
GVLATAKHFIGDGSADFGLEGGEISLSMEEITNRLLPPYKAAIEAGVGAVMASFNTMDEVPMHANKKMIQEILKNKMGFEGLMVSDWKAYSRFGENDIVNAGIDMVMAVDGDLEMFRQGLKSGVESGTVAMERIDDAVRRILRQKIRMGLFENPFPNPDLISKIGTQQHRDLARQAVRESLVLLKNNDATLPLDKAVGKIVVVGEHADNAGLQSGGWTIHWQGTDQNYKGATTILQGIRGVAEGDVAYDKEGLGDHEDADVAIVVIGETPYAEFFGDIGGEVDAYQLYLSEKQKSYLDTYAKKGIKTVVLLISGRPLVVTGEIEQSDAFIAAWLPGSEGDGIAEVLFGDYNFKGKLPHSWPAAVEDYQGKYGPNFWDDSITPLFPFGYGLEY